MRRLILVSVLVVSGLGCSPKAVYMSAESYHDRPQLAQSLFPSDNQVMSDAAIQTILSSRIVIPQKARIVVLNFGPERWRYWSSEEVSQLDQAALKNFVEKIRSCDRVGDAFVLPSMLSPENQTVPYLRQAAARCQADLIFLYRSTSEVYQRQRALGRDKTKAYCLVEAVLLDTRTGIVPFASPAVKSYTAEKSSKDINFSETIRKAELKALGEALDEIANELVAFLESVPTTEQ